MNLVVIDTDGMTERERRTVERAERAALRCKARTRYLAESRGLERGQKMALLYRIAADVGLDDDEARNAVYRDGR